VLWIAFAVVAFLKRNDPPPAPPRHRWDPPEAPETPSSPDVEVDGFRFSYGTDGSMTIGTGQSEVQLNKPLGESDTGDPRRDATEVAVDLAARRIDEATLPRFVDAVSVLVRLDVELPTAADGESQATAELVRRLVDADEAGTREALRGHSHWSPQSSAPPSHARCGSRRERSGAPPRRRPSRC
jgi:hypothetical protein